jgi:hypothetical protein
VKRGPKAGAVLQLKGPQVVERGGEELAAGAEEVQGKERVAVGVWGREFVGEGAVGDEVGAKGDGLEAVGKVAEGGIVPEEAGRGGDLEQPGEAVVVLAVAGEPSGAGGGEPIEVGLEDGVERGPGVRRETEVGEGDGEFGERQGVEHALGVGGRGLWRLCPGVEQSEGLLGVAGFVGDEEGGG